MIATNHTYKFGILATTFYSELHKLTESTLTSLAVLVAQTTSYVKYLSCSWLVFLSSPFTYRILDKTHYTKLAERVFFTTTLEEQTNISGK